MADHAPWLQNPPAMAPLPANVASSPIGTITEVHGPVTLIACERLPPLDRALLAQHEGDRYLFEVHQHLTGQYDQATEEQCYMRGGMKQAKR